MASGTQARKLEGHEAPVTSVAVSKDGRTIVSGSGDIYGTGITDNSVR